MKINAHILDSADQEFTGALEAALDSRVRLTTGEKMNDPDRCHILVSGRPPGKYLKAGSNLHTLIIPWSGLPIATRELMSAYPHISVHNLHHNAAPVAETAVSLMLAAAREIVPVDRLFRDHDWRPRYRPGRQIYLGNKTALILGYGAVGRKIERICRGLGMSVTAIKKRIDSNEGTDTPIFGRERLPELLRGAAVLFVCLPLTVETEGMIGPEELKLLPDEGIIVNIARGAIIEEQALYDELNSGRLRAGLDVWYNYPDSEDARSDTAPAACPFEQLDNVVMTPHMAGHSDITERLRAEHLAELLNAAAGRRPIPNKVDLQGGY